jgi:hypothetical protein
MMTLGRELMDNIHTARCGVIPFCIAQNSVHFLVGLDKRFSEVTDMGGCVKSNEKTLYGGLRELHEESRGVFDNIRIQDLEMQIALVDRNKRMSVIFLPVKYECKDEIIVNFTNNAKLVQGYGKKKRKAFDELSDLMWVNDEVFIRWIHGQTYINEPPMWDRFSKFFRHVIRYQPSFINALKTISY